MIDEKFMWGIQFEIKAPLGHFRNPYTTTLKQTYPFPPKPTIIGTIGAMMGWDEKEVLRKIDEFKVSIPFWEYKGKITEFAFIISIGKLRGKSRQQEEFRPERFEILLFPIYQIVLLHSDNDLIKEIEERIKKRDFVFPIFMGKNELIISEIKLLHPLSRFKINKVATVSGIIFKEGKTIPEFTVKSSKPRPAEIFIGVPKSLQMVNGKREQREVCVALAAKALIELKEPQEGIQLNDIGYTII